MPVILPVTEVAASNQINMVKLYITPACPYCFTLKEFLKENNISFEEIDVSKDTVARDEIIKKAGQVGVPIIDINGEIVVGFDRGKIIKLLGIK